MQCGSTRTDQNYACIAKYLKYKAASCSPCVFDQSVKYCVYGVGCLIRASGMLFLPCSFK